MAIRRIVATTITAVVCVVIVLLTIFPLPGVPTITVVYIVEAQASWLSGWDYRKAINITGQTGAGHNYTVKMRVGGSSNASGEDFDLEGHASLFPADICFTDDDGTTLLDFWLEVLEGEAFEEQDRVTEGYPNDFDVFSNGNRTIVSVLDSDEVVLYNTANKSNMVEIDSLSVTEGHDVKVIDGTSDYAYHCGWTSNKFEIVDMTDEENLSIADNVTLSTEPFYCDPHLIDGDRIVFVIGYDTGGDSALYSFNCTNHTITQMDSISGTGDNYDFTDDGWRVKYHPGYELVLACTSDAGADGAVNVIDASNPANLTALHKYEDGDWIWPNMFIEGNRVYGCEAANDTIIVADIASNGTLTKLGEYESSTYIDNVHGIYVEDSIIYVSSWLGDYDLAVLDATDPSDIVLVDAYQDATLSEGHSIYKSGDFIWYACANCDVVAIFEYGAGTAQCATMWVEVADNLASNQTIYCYYGNEGQSFNSTRADGQRTFRAFEDFSAGSHIFTIQDAAPTHIAHDTTNDHLDCTGMTNGEDAYAYYDMGAGQIDDFLLGFTSQLTQSSISHERADIGVADELDDAYNNDLFIGFDGLPSSAYADYQAIQVITTSATYGADVAITSGTVYYNTVTRSGTTTTLSVYSDEPRTSQVGSDSTITSSTNAVQYLFAVASMNYADVRALGDSYVDTIYLVNYVSPSPAFSSAGSEETEGVCSPSISLNTSSWSANSGDVVATSSNYSSGLTYFTITNNSGGAVDITVGGVDMAGGGYTWDLADDGLAGDMIVALYAGREGEAYNIIVRETASYNTLVAGLADSGTQSFGLTMCTPTNFDDGNTKSGNVTLTVACS